MWGLVLDDQLVKPPEFRVVHSRSAAPQRQLAQQSLLTRLEHATHLDVEAYLTSRGLAHWLEVYVIPAQVSPRAMWDLQLMNITRATLFPDLDGAAAQANVGSAYWYGGLIQ